MDRICQWAWDRHAARYSWAIYTLVVAFTLPIYLFWSFLIVAVDGSGGYGWAALVTIVALPVLGYVNMLPGLGPARVLSRWVTGDEVDGAKALAATYELTRAAVSRVVLYDGVCVGLLSVVVAWLGGATSLQLAQYAVLGVAVGTAFGLSAMHNFAEAAIRPARVAIAGNTGIGEALPQSRPTFAAWSNIFLLAVVFTFAVNGAMLAAAVEQTREHPILFAAIACALTLALGLPFTVGGGFSASLQPIRDLAKGTERVAAGHYGRRLPVVQDDDLGVLTASFNRMQAGLAERQRLQEAFGTYVDPALAARLLEQVGDVFSGDRRVVTVIFIDIRDFTPFAEAHSAEDTVARLNALFEIVVPAVVDAGGHVNKFLGDGALAVFGAPNDLENHAGAALSSAVRIQDLVEQCFGGGLRIGIGINTGLVIAGTIGAAGKLEFTLIGDTVNIAARVEQLTKETGDSILLTEHTVNALESPRGLIERGSHGLKGKSAAVKIFGVDPAFAQLGESGGSHD